MVWVWLLLIIIAVILDFSTSDFLFSGFALGSIIALVMSILDVSVSIQLITFAVIGIIFIFTAYPFVKKKLSKDKLDSKTMEENYIGRTFIVDKDITSEALIKFDGIYWTFKTKEFIPRGTNVKIIEIQGNKLLIEKF